MELFCIFSSSFTIKRGWAWYHIAVYSLTPMPPWRKWSKEEKIGIPAGQEYGQQNSLQWQQGTDSLLIFPNLFYRSVFRVPALEPPKEQCQEHRWESSQPSGGVHCSTGSLMFDPWFNSENTLAGVLEICSSFFPVCWHSGIVWMSSKPMQLQLGHLCSRTAVLQVARKWLFIYLPVTFSTGLFYLISSPPAVQFFSPLCPFSSLLLMGQQHFPMALLAGRWVHRVLQSAASDSSRNLLCSPPSSTAPELHPAFEHQGEQDPEAGC